MRNAYYWDKAFLDHDTGPHVECVERAEQLAPDRMQSQVPGLTVFPAANFNAAQWIPCVHESAYVDFIRHACEKGRTVVDQGDTVVSLLSHDAAVTAVNALLSAGDAIMTGQADNAFCAVRPPGHHALPGRAMGF